MDATRNKAMIHAKMDVGSGLIGEVDTLIDFTEGITITSVPILDICQNEEIGEAINLESQISGRILSPMGSAQLYKGL